MNTLSYYYQLFKYALRGEKGFYEAREFLAEILIQDLEEFIDLKNKKVLDVGGERGEFCQIFAQKRNCRAINLEPYKLDDDFVWKTIIGRVQKLPFPNESFDIVLFRGVIQHIPTAQKAQAFAEIYRVLKKGGICYLMIPPWYSPLSGQNIKPFQYFPFKIARHLRNSIFNSQIKADSLAELGLWPMTIKRTLGYIAQTDFRVLKTYDILFRGHFISRIPVLREFLLASVGFVLKK